MSPPPKPTAIIHERCRVHPRAAMTSQSVPLTFLDMIWLHFHPIQRLLFYKFPCSKTQFLQTIVPNLKQSLSQTLDHFLPLSGNLIYPLNSSKPELRYVHGDSVSVSIAESNEGSDLNYLTGNGARDCDEFYTLFPDLPEPVINSESKIIPLFSVQITLFPDSGICIGFNNHHAVGDASSIVKFIKAWSTNTKAGNNDHSLPYMLYDRSVIKDPSGLADKFWNQMKHIKIDPLPTNFPTNKVRATCILTKDDVQRLKNLASSNKPNLLHLSSFTVTTGYIWSSLAKSAASENIAGETPEHFALTVDARSRLDPPVDPNYFGNCVAVVKTETTHQLLKGKHGFFTAVELIGEMIAKKVNSKDKLLREAGNWLSDFGALIGQRMFGVAGSPRFDLYGTDFCWGNPMKFESVSIDGDGSMSLCKSREYEGGLEIGLALEKGKMEKFTDVFADGLEGIM